MRKIANKPRYAGTEGEREAYTLISKEFKRLGCDVEKEETEYIKSDLYAAMLGIVTLWLFLVLIVASWLVHPLTTALLIIALAAFMSKVFPRLTLSLARDRSINVIATMNSKGKNRLILCGHYDSARVGSKFFQKFRKALVNVQPFFLLAFIVYIAIVFVRGTYIFAIEGFSFASLLELSPRMTGVWSVVWWSYIAVFTPFMLLFTYGWMATIYINKFSYGADDNASGIAVLMETARRLQGRKLNLRVDFACFAAEEKGLFGSRKWVNKHLKELDRERTYVLNIDCVGRGEKFFITKGLGTIFKKRSDPTLCNIVADVCSELKFPLEECWAGNSDHAEFVEKKFRTCAISRFNSLRANIAHVILRRMFGIPLKKNVVNFHDWIHTENDTADNIDERKLEESVQLVVRFVEKLNKKLE
ncbi:MAG: M28 family metallopeptidase [Candidatus Bathyarchaeia archaeon]